MGIGTIVEATVASRDVERAVDFQRRAFEWEVMDQAGSEVSMGVPGSLGASVRLIEATADPEIPPPNVWEIGPRILRVRTRDTRQSRELFEDAGGVPGPICAYSSDVSEFIGLGVDDVIYAVSCWEQPRFPSPALDADPDRLHSELNSVSLVVPDMSETRTFFVIAGGLTVPLYLEDIGEPYTDAFGLPRGASFGTVTLSGDESKSAVLELLQFHGVEGTEPRERTVGIKRITYAPDSESSEELITGLVQEGAEPVGPNVVKGPVSVEIELRKED